MNYTRLVAAALVLAAPINAAAAATVHYVHSFAGGVNDGANPYGGVIASGKTLYGTTLRGGDFDRGTVYKVNADGSGFQLLHEFNAFVDPSARLLLSGNTLYGATGGINNGVIFRVSTDGTGYQELHTGITSFGGLVQSGNTLYGTSYSGGGGTAGAVFKINTDGSGYQVLHNFVGGASDGSSPFGGLLLSGSTLYGTTVGGGDNDDGTIFKLNANGTGFQLLHEFKSGVTQGGRIPNGDLIQIGSRLYGTTFSGGQGNYSTIFRINTDGTGFAKVRDFGQSISGAHAIVSGLVTDGTKLYGASRRGGPDDVGVLFSLNLNGSGYEALHNFGATTSDGREPRYGPLLLVGSRLYGTTTFGGAGARRAGTIYWVAIPEPQTLAMLAIGLTAAAIGRRPGRG